MSTKKLYIVDGLRTPFCKMGSQLADIPADELGRSATTALLAQLDIDPALIDHVIFGCVGQPPESPNLARVIALRSGIPHHVPAVTVQRNCASGLESITHAYDKMAAGQGDIFLVGGAENMSQIPLFYEYSTAQKFAALSRARSLGQKIAQLLRFRPSDFSPKVGLMLGLTDPTCGLNMGQTAENLARDFKLSRQAQDEFSVESHHKAEKAQTQLDEEITPIYHRGQAITQDNGIRKSQTLEALAKLKTVFDRHTGTVTPGNASQITDGAVALLLATEDACKQHNLRPIGSISTYHYAGCDPSRMGIGPVHAIAGAEAKSGLGIPDADIIEINEAFAAQVLAVTQAARSTTYSQEHLGRSSALGEIDPQILNPNGGAIALGHPVGASGSRLALTALKELHRRNKQRALISLCIGGGQGGALWLEKE